MSVDLEPQRLFTGECLVVDSAGPRYLLAMKLLSGRKRDEDDCIHLIREVGVSRVEDLLDLMETAAGIRALSPQHEYRAREWFTAARRWHRLRRLRGWISVKFQRSATAKQPAARIVPPSIGMRQCGKPNKSKAGTCGHPHPGSGGRCAAGHRH